MEVGRQEMEVGRQEMEVGRQKSEVGCRRSEVGGQRLSCQLAVHWAWAGDLGMADLGILI
jgi:hypothetical protein